MDAKVTRLTDMVTEEVSLVDRAANRRKFLFVKRDDSMSTGAAVVAGPNGLTTGSQAQAAPAPATADNVDTSKAAAVLPKDVKESMLSVLEEASSSIDTIMKSVKGAKVSDKPEEYTGMDEIMDEVMSVSALLEEACNACMDAMAPPETPAADPAAEGETPSVAPPPPADVGKAIEVAMAKRLVMKAELSGPWHIRLRKYGAKLKKERHQRLLMAVEQLSALAAELSPTTVDKAKCKPAAAAPPKAATKKSLDAEDPKIAALQQQVEQLTVQLKKSLEAAAVAKQPQQSNATAVDSTPRAKPFVWPSDMSPARSRK